MTFLRFGPTMERN